MEKGRHELTIVVVIGRRVGHLRLSHCECEGTGRAGR